MNRILSKLAIFEALGGPGSGGAREGAGRHRTRSDIAKVSYVPATKEMQVKADEWQTKLAKVLGARVTANNSPADLLKGSDAIEVKTVQSSKKDRVEMRPDSREKKEAFVKDNNMQGHTIAIDLRGSTPKFYYRSGFGAYRFGSMEQVSSLRQLSLKFK